MTIGWPCLVGCHRGKMIHESFQGDACERTIDVASLSVLLVLSVATSIDALAVGLSLSFIDVPIARRLITIGAVTALLSWAASMSAGAAAACCKPGTAPGGLILVGIGLRIVISQLTAAPRSPPPCSSGPVLPPIQRRPDPCSWIRPLFCTAHLWQGHPYGRPRPGPPPGSDRRHRCAVGAIERQAHAGAASYRPISRRYAPAGASAATARA